MVLLYFIDRDEALKSEVKTIVLNNVEKNIWNTGIEIGEQGEVSQSIMTSVTPVYTEATKRGGSFHNGLNWSAGDIEKIYFGLEEAVSKIKKCEDKFKDNYSNYILLRDMYNFLTNESEIVSKLQNYDEILAEVSDRCKQVRGFDAIKEGLSSKNGNEVLRAISLLKEEFEKEEHACYETELQILFNKIVTQQEPL